MRKFNQREQDIIRKLVNYYKDRDKLNTIGLFLTEKIVGDDYKIAIHEDEQYLVYCKDDDKKSILYQVVEIINLFRELIENHLIVIMPGQIEGFLFIGTNEEPVNENGTNKVTSFKNGDYIKREDLCWYDKNDQLKYGFFTFTEQQFKIKDFIASVPLISPELEILVDDNFKTIEEKTLCVTQFAACISFLAFIVAMIFPFITQTKIDSKQHKEYIDTIQSVKDEISHSTNQITDAVERSIGGGVVPKDSL